ncbi:fungal-specific transcription factor domain-containing protein [Aspergillus pseudoustus]|uniref:Fungal-specific transcription factor domain-containing protein n=1 Tax=Aspergillus pseudoustus TaxID=1810923 RepID=A0ABR4JV99_9EURO
MFHTFDTAASSRHIPSPKPPGRTKTNKSCSECMRRKVKCDGAHPCSSCEYYRISESCVYRQRSRRQTTSRSSLDKATETIRRQASVLHSLCPNSALDDLVGKSRLELIQIITQQSPEDEQRVLRGTLPLADPADSLSEEVCDAHEEPSSDQGDAEEDRHWDERAENPATIPTGDDINAVGLASDRHRRSYLGICSVSAVLKALFRLSPGAKDRIVEASKFWPEVDREPNIPALPLLTPTALAAPPPVCDPLREARYVGFYFEHIHGITPFIHEETFRATIANPDRQSHAWLGLYNMVITVGSIASGSDTAHIQYYNHARSYLDLDSLGSGNLETLQALCLLGGYYLHYRNSPNMAYGILGAAQRLAIALGLHRESPVRTHTHNNADADAAQRYAIRVETRRRTWWSLYCLDTWASMTLGRPTCGRWDSTTMNISLPACMYPDDHIATSLRASAEFCHIGNRVQHLFAQSTRISANVAQGLDNELQAWYASLGLALTETANAPPQMAVAREFLRNRYYNLRLILSRCFLLYQAYDEPRRRKGNYPRRDDGEDGGLVMSDLCRSIAAEAIDAIALHWVPNRIQVWNAAWYLFQACMVPLLSIAMTANPTSATGIITSGDDLDSSDSSTTTLRTSWYTTLAKALETFTEMKPWLRGSDRTPNIVEALVQAVSVTGSHIPSANEAAPATISIHTPSVSDGGLHMFGLPDEFLTEMDWSAMTGAGDGGGDLFDCLFPLT